MIDQMKKERRRRLSATIAFFSEAFRFIVIPIILLELVMNQFPLLTPEMSTRIANNLIIFGGLVAIFSGLEAYFPRESLLKMSFGLLSVATLCAWFWVIFSGGALNFPYGPLNISVNASGIVLLIIIAIALKGVHNIFRYLVARDEKIAKERAALEKQEIPVEVLAAEPEHPEPSFLYWYHEPEAPPETEDIMKCPVCLCDLSPEDKVCPDCGAWTRLNSRQYPASSSSARDLVE